MKVQKDSDKSNNTQTEIKHLKATIDALRSELENNRAGKQQSIQRAVADANDEIAQLKETIISLRKQLEQQNQLCPDEKVKP